VDLNTDLVYSESMMKFLKSLFDIDILGFQYNKNKTIFDKQENIVLRTNYGSMTNSNIEFGKNKNFFLIGSFFKGNAKENFYNVDILTVKHLHDIKSFLKKYNGKNIGIEFLISDIRYCGNSELGKWFSDMKWIYELCKKYGFQFILSSGANKSTELISSKVFNILLEKMDIKNRNYWQDLESWLGQKKVYAVYDSG
jgi:hypothetical protein